MVWSLAKFLEGAPERFDAALCVASADSHGPLEAACEPKVGTKRMGFGVRDEHINVLVGARQIASPEKTEIALSKAADIDTAWSVRAASCTIWRARSLACTG